MECWSPTIARLARTERLPRSTVKRIARRCGDWNLTDALEQQLPCDVSSFAALPHACATRAPAADAGSLRNPANACGIASIRPSAGRVRDAGYAPAEDRLLAVQLMNVQGPMAPRVADVRLGLRVLMGAHPRDPWSIAAPFDAPLLARPIRVAELAEPTGGSTDPKVAATVRRAAQALADAGYVVEEACPPRYDDAVSCWTRLIVGDFGSVLGMLSPMMGADAMAFLNNFNQAVPPLADAAAWSQLMVERDGIARASSIFMADRPLLLPRWNGGEKRAGHVYLKSIKHFSAGRFAPEASERLLMHEH
jgi:hypothetical protein